MRAFWNASRGKICGGLKLSVYSRSPDKLYHVTNKEGFQQNCVVWAAQILCGNALLGFSVVFLEAAGFSELQAFDVNISLSACYIIGGIICWLIFPHLGRATIYMGGMAFMFVCLMVIGGLGWVESKSAQMAIGVLFVISTLCNMITVGPACYPIVAETPSGRLRYKTIVIGRFVYNLTGIVHNIITPRMISATGEFHNILTYSIPLNPVG
jgi:SP family general alpha glucoside:H+ symporter-like MFS transporter